MSIATKSKKSQKSKVFVYVIRYREGEQEKWLPESYHFTIAREVCRSLAKRGKKPVMFKVDTTIAELLQLGSVSRVSAKGLGDERQSDASFDAKQAADGSFSNEFNRWLQTVVDSQCVDSVLNAGLLCRAIKAHAASYLNETVGMGSRDAEDQFEQIIDGGAEADEGHRIYGILGISDPSE